MKNRPESDDILYPHIRPGHHARGPKARACKGPNAIPSKGRICHTRWVDFSDASTPYFVIHGYNDVVQVIHQPPCAATI